LRTKHSGLEIGKLQKVTSDTNPDIFFGLRDLI
jgi:hypothetical protein